MDKKLLLALVLSIGTLWVWHYYNRSSQIAQQFTSVPTDAKPGQAYKVPTVQDLARPINKEIDFLDKKITKKEEIKRFETDSCIISFSNFGAVLSQIDFKKYIGKNGTPLRTIHHKGFFEREQSAFLLALDEKTPYFYDLVDTKDLDDRIEIVYQTQVNGWQIRKNYIFYKKFYKLDLTLEFEPKSKEVSGIRPRLFFPSPFVGEITNDTINGFTVGLDGKSANKISESELNQAWIAPSLFGVEDKYFVHSLVSDKQNFVQRTFFKLEEKKIFPILEGPEIKEKSSWNLSFYIGPKTVDDMALVDERLEDLLSFGWLSWICKLLLKLLAWLYSFLQNFGLAIIALTILLKLPFTPLTILGRKKAEEFQKYQPQIKRINFKYKNNVKAKQEEIMRFYKEHNISPAAPVLGCLPFIIQMPILFALYRVLGGYLDLYQAPFFGWITDLSSKDPYYILPILMGASAFWQQKLNPIADKKQKVMFMFMPLIMTAIFLNMPSGLVLYWLMNNLLMIGEDSLRKAYFK